MKTSCVAPPASLVEITFWFAKAISSPFGAMEGKESASRYLTPGPLLTAEDRLYVYHEQYWLRLLSAMALDFPTVVRLFGRADFEDTLAIPYLVAYPPKHWSLNDLGTSFSRWLQESYQNPDLPLVLAAAELDMADLEVTLADKGSTTLQFSDPEELLEAPFQLASHVRLFTFDRDYPHFRHLILEKEEEDGWIDVDFPPIGEKQDRYFVFFRNKNRFIVSEEIDKKQWDVLKEINESTTLVELIEKQQDDPEFQQQIPRWVQRWVFLGWLHFITEE